MGWFSITSAGVTSTGDDARFAAIDDIVGMIAQMRASTLQPHRGGIRIGGADFEISRALVEAMTSRCGPPSSAIQLCRAAFSLASSSCSASERRWAVGEVLSAWLSC